MQFIRTKMILRKLPMPPRLLQENSLHPLKPDAVLVWILGLITGVVHPAAWKRWPFPIAMYFAIA
jgi:hypothetical protein